MLGQLITQWIKDRLADVFRQFLQDRWVEIVRNEQTVWEAKGLRLRLCLSLLLFCSVLASSIFVRYSCLCPIDLHRLVSIVSCCRLGLSRSITGYLGHWLILTRAIDDFKS